MALVMRLPALPSKAGCLVALGVSLSACARAAGSPTPTRLPAAIGASGIGDPAFPSLGNGGYDVRSYAVDLDVDVAARRLQADVTISAVASQPLAAFNLDMEGFDILSVEVDGQPAQTSRLAGELRIAPADPIGQGEAFTVHVSYAGSPGGLQADGLLPFALGWQFFDGGAYVASEPDGTSRWLPSNDHPLDKATYVLRVTVDEPYDVACNGLRSDTTAPEGRRTFVC